MKTAKEITSKIHILINKLQDKRTSKNIKEQISSNIIMLLWVLEESEVQND